MICFFRYFSVVFSFLLLFHVFFRHTSFQPLWLKTDCVTTSNSVFCSSKQLKFLVFIFRRWWIGFYCAKRLCHQELLEFRENKRKKSRCQHTNNFVRIQCWMPNVDSIYVRWMFQQLGKIKRSLCCVCVSRIVLRLICAWKRRNWCLFRYQSVFTVHCALCMFDAHSTRLQFDSSFLQS